MENPWFEKQSIFQESKISIAALQVFRKMDAILEMSKAAGLLLKLQIQWIGLSEV